MTRKNSRTISTIVHFSISSNFKIVDQPQSELEKKQKSKMAAALKRSSDDLQIESQTGFVGQKHVCAKNETKTTAVKMATHQNLTYSEKEGFS